MGPGRPGRAGGGAASMPAAVLARGPGSRLAGLCWVLPRGRAGCARAWPLAGRWLRAWVLLLAGRYARPGWPLCCAPGPLCAGLAAVLAVGAAVRLAAGVAVRLAAGAAVRPGLACPWESL